MNNGIFDLFLEMLKVADFYYECVYIKLAIANKTLKINYCFIKFVTYDFIMQIQVI